MCNPRSDRVRALRVLVVGLALSALAAGCATLELPERFLVVERGVGEVKAITPDESKVWLRDFEEAGGDLAFWSEALEGDLVNNRGYVLLEKKAITDGAGKAGNELLFETQAMGRPVRYLIAVFVYDSLFGTSRIRTIEYVADKDVFDVHVEDVRKAIASHR